MDPNISGVQRLGASHSNIAHLNLEDNIFKANASLFPEPAVFLTPPDQFVFDSHRLPFDYYGSRKCSRRIWG